MKKRSNAYWDKRALERMAEYHRGADITIRTVTAAYEAALKSIKAEMDQIFGTYSRNSGLSPEQARTLLNETVPRAEWEAMRQQIQRVRNPDIRRRLLARVNAPAYRARITRLQALQEQVYLQSKLVADVELTASRAGYVDTINQAYYRTMYDIQKGLGTGFEFTAMPQDTAKEILRQPWSGEHFSSRIWTNTDTLAEKLTDIITGGINGGVSHAKMTMQLADQMQVGKYVAARLIRTETTHMANASEIVSYEEAEIDRYLFLATLDSRTSAQCRKADGKVYKVSEAKAGVNLPPLHPFCRSTTRVYFGAETLAGIQRRAKHPITGETQLVPANMNYDEWLKKYGAKKG